MHTGWYLVTPSHSLDCVTNTQRTMAWKIYSVEAGAENVKPAAGGKPAADVKPAANVGQWRRTDCVFIDDELHHKWKQTEYSLHQSSYALLTS